MVDHSQVQILEIGDKSDGQRLDNFLFRELKGLPKSRVYRLIRKGEVRINRKRSKPDSRLVSGDKVRIPPLRLTSRAQPPKPSPGLSSYLLDSVLFENEQFVVLNKPAGLPVHGGSGVHLGLIEALRQLKPQWSQLELAHRLDRDTSGCMVFAKTPLFLRDFHLQLKQKTVNKTYIALVHGYWPDSLVLVDAPLLKNHLQSGERMVKFDPSGKPSETRFEVIEHLGVEATLIKALPITGRTHQIRVHCQIQGHAILGDDKYASQAQAKSHPAATRLCLHAEKIEFQVPDGGGLMLFEAPLSDYLAGQLNLLRSKQ